MAKKLRKKILRRLFPKKMAEYEMYKYLIKNECSYIHKTGWYRSYIEKKPVDRHGEVIPWMSFPVVSILDEKLNADLTMFEYGSGFSTKFYAKRVKSIISLEYDEE